MNLSEMLANIESLKKIAEQLEMDIKVIDDYVIFEDSSKKYCKICLGEYKSDVEKDVLFLNSTNASPNTINLADLEKLIELKNNTNKQQFLVLLNMIFAVCVSRQPTEYSVHVVKEPFIIQSGHQFQMPGQKL